MILNYFLFILIILFQNNKSNGIFNKHHIKNHFSKFFENKFHNDNNLQIQSNNCNGDLSKEEYLALWSFANSSEIVNSICFNKTLSSTWVFNGTNYDAPCKWNQYINCSTLIRNNNYCTVTSLILQNCQLNGTITSSISNLTSIEIFEIKEARGDSYDMEFFYNSVVLSEFSVITHKEDSDRLSILGEIKSGLHGSIPSELGLCTNLKILTLENLFIHGTLPSTLGNLINLQYLRIEGLILHGPLPDELFNLDKLSYLHIGANLMNGTLSDRIGLLTNLKSLVIYSNLMTGSIPETIKNLNQLTELGIFDLPRFTCDIPDISLLVNLETLYLAGFFGPNISSGSIKVCQFPDLHLPNLHTFIVGGGFYIRKLPKFTLPTVQYFYFGLGLWEDKLDDLVSNLPSTVIGMGLTAMPCVYGQIPGSIEHLVKLHSLLVNDFPTMNQQENFKYILNSSIKNILNSSFDFRLDRKFCSKTLSGSLPVEMTSMSTLKWIGFLNTPLNGSFFDVASSWSSIFTIFLLDNRYNTYHLNQ